jgi:hypothetical protein
MQRGVTWMMAGLISLLAATTAAAYADEPAQSITEHGLTVHYGVMPATKAQNVERGADAVPKGADATPGLSSYHLVVALFRSNTDERIKDATVLATVKGPKGPKGKAHSRPVTKHLEPMLISDTVTYGNFFDMRWRGVYHVTLAVTRKNESKPVKVSFDVD